jgi:hypothetical protein
MARVSHHMQLLWWVNDGSVNFGNPAKADFQGSRLTHCPSGTGKIRKLLLSICRNCLSKKTAVPSQEIRQVGEKAARPARACKRPGGAFALPELLHCFMTSN